MRLFLKFSIVRRLWLHRLLQNSTSLMILMFRTISARSPHPLPLYTITLYLLRVIRCMRTMLLLSTNPCADQDCLIALLLFVGWEQGG